MTVTINVSDTVARLLEVLAFDQLTREYVEEDREERVKYVIEELIDHAQQGVYRPGSWERPWLHQAFGDAWESLLEPGDPHGRDDATSRRIFQRPRAKV